EARTERRTLRLVQSQHRVESMLPQAALRPPHTPAQARTIRVRVRSFCYPAAVPCIGAAMPSLRVVPDLANEALVTLDSALDYYIHQKKQQVLDVTARQLPTSHALLDQQNQLFKCKLGARCVHTGDGARVAGIHIA